MAELVDAPDLGSGVLGRAGSIPVLGIFLFSSPRKWAFLCLRSCCDLGTKKPDCNYLADWLLEIVYRGYSEASIDAGEKVGSVSAS